jgi:hypothetical protein
VHQARNLRLAIAIVLALASVRTFIPMMFSSRIRSESSSLGEYFDQSSPEYPRFLTSVAAATPAGSRIAIFVPMRRWDEGYSYAYYRASYFLAGRDVLPVVWRDDRLIAQNVERAEYIASWNMKVGAKGFQPILKAHGGTLYRRAP